MLLEGNQPGIVAVRSSQVEFFSPCLLGILDDLPEEQRHTTEIVQTRIGATVLVDHPLSVAQGQDARHRLALLGGDVDKRILTEAADEVAKPLQRLRRDVVALTSEPPEAIQLREKRLAPATLVGQSFSFRPVDPLLNTTFVEAAQQGIQAGPKVQPMQVEGLGHL